MLVNNPTEAERETHSNGVVQQLLLRGGGETHLVSQDPAVFTVMTRRSGDQLTLLGLGRTRCSSLEKPAVLLLEDLRLSLDAMQFS